MQERLALYHGEFLEGYNPARISADFELWIVRERERLHQLAVMGFTTLYQRQMALGEYAAALHSNRQLLKLVPWDETAHQQQILLLAQSGHHAAALAHFVRCRQILEEELGGEPAAETFGLAQQVQMQRFAHLQSRQLLLFLENFEHVLAGTRALIMVLNRAPQLKIVVTSRACLKVCGESLLPLKHLSLLTIHLDTDSKKGQRNGDTPVEKASWQESEAIAMFVQRAQLLDPEFVLDAQAGLAYIELYHARAEQTDSSTYRSRYRAIHNRIRALFQQIHQHPAATEEIRVRIAQLINGLFADDEFAIEHTHAHLANRLSHVG